MKKKLKFTQPVKIDVQSRYSESNLEYVSKRDEDDLIAHIKYMQEKEFNVSYEERE